MAAHDPSLIPNSAAPPPSAPSPTRKQKQKRTDVLRSLEQQALVESVTKVLGELYEKVKSADSELANAIESVRVQAIGDATAVARSEVAKLTTGPLRAGVAAAQRAVDQARADLAIAHEAAQDAADQAENAWRGAVRSYAALKHKQGVGEILEKMLPDHRSVGKRREAVCSAVGATLLLTLQPVQTQLLDHSAALKAVGRAEDGPHLPSKPPPAQLDTVRTAREALPRFVDNLEALLTTETLPDDEVSELKVERALVTQRVIDDALLLGGIRQNMSAAARTLDQRSYLDLHQPYAQKLFDKVRGDCELNLAALAEVLRSYQKLLNGEMPC